VSIPLRTLAERVSVELTSRHAAKQAELDGLLPPALCARPHSRSLTRGVYRRGAGDSSASLLA
jgi:hypothetical protein